MVSDAEVWRTNTVTAPSQAPASVTKAAMSGVTSTNCAPAVRTLSVVETTVLTSARFSAVRELRWDELITSPNVSDGEGKATGLILAAADHP